MKPFLAVLTLFSVLAACAPAQETTAQEVTFTSADEIDAVVEAQMLEIDKATVEIDGERFTPELLVPDMENNLLYLIFAGSSRALALPIDVAKRDMRPTGTIVLLDISGEEATALHVLEDYDLSEDGESFVVSGHASTRWRRHG